MAIDYRQLRGLTVRRLISALLRAGFQEWRRKGATRFYTHPDGRTLTLHVHSLGQTFKTGTLKSIIEKQARWTEADLIRLKLIKP
jgi:predicted RNA binding protein YcfA (HicA-like mRNA interferase family)